MRSNCFLLLACGLAGCFYDWRYKPTDTEGGDGGAGSGAATTGGGDGASDPGACAECAGAASRQCPSDKAACATFEGCAATMGCVDLFSCLECFQDNQPGFSRWSCLATICDDACAGTPIPCG